MYVKFGMVTDILHVIAFIQFSKCGSCDACWRKLTQSVGQVKIQVKSPTFHFELMRLGNMSQIRIL